MAPIGTAGLGYGADDHGPDHVLLLYCAAGGSSLNGCHDHIADAGDLTAGTAQNPDAHDFLSAGVVGDVQHGLHLNHGRCSSELRTEERCAAFMRPVVCKPGIRTSSETYKS